MRSLPWFAAVVGVVLIGTGTVVSAEPPLLSPPDQAIISWPNPAKGVLLFTWQATAGVSEYRFIVSSRSDLSVRVVERTVSRPSATVRGFAEGSYWWTVEPVGSKATAPTAAHSFKIKAGTP